MPATPPARDESLRGDGEALRARARRRLDALRAGFALVLIAKLVLVGLWWQSASAGAGTRATAGTPAAPARRDATTVATAGREAAGGGDERVAATGTEQGAAPDVHALLAAVARRNAELDAREHELESREERLRVFERDVTAKVASLEEIEKRLLVRSKEADAAIAAAGESLAKIYAAMKPGDAAPILEQLDDATVLMIFGRMKEKQVGEILPLMSRDKAIVLTRSLAERR